MVLIRPVDARGRPSPVHIKRPSDKRSSSRSATRALDVLEYFGNERRPLRAVEISKAIGMHPSTTNQLLKTLVDSAHLVFNARTMTYLPSPRLVGFSGWVVECYGPKEWLCALVRDAQSHTGHIVTISTANDLFMQILEVAAPPGPPAERGQRVSLFGSAIGSAYLSTLDEEEVDRLAYRARIPDGELPRLRRELDTIRLEGFADGRTLGNEQSVGDIWSIALPLPDRGLPMRLVLGLAGPTDHVLRDRHVLVGRLREAIDRWSRIAPT